MGETGTPWRIEVLQEDDALLALVKPAGLPTANAPRGKASVYSLLADRFGPAAFVGIVSRLDAPVSGLVVVAKSNVAAASLAQQFRDRTVEKRYLAVVTGRFPAPLQEWVDWHDQISRAEGERCSVIVPPPGRRDGGSRPDASPSSSRLGQRHVAAGQAAHTRARVLRRAGEVSLVELEPVTGRRHQLRVQLASRGCPIVGDRLYGSRLPFSEPGGIALHAAELALAHPTTGRRLQLAAPFPAAWRSGYKPLMPGPGAAPFPPRIEGHNRIPPGHG